MVLKTLGWVTKKKKTPPAKLMELRITVAKYTDIILRSDPRNSSLTPISGPADTDSSTSALSSNASECEKINGFVVFPFLWVALQFTKLQATKVKWNKRKTKEKQIENKQTFLPTCSHNKRFTIILLIFLFLFLGGPTALLDIYKMRVPYSAVKRNPKDYSEELQG